MELSITTPALLFPAISLLMLAYTNRFLENLRARIWLVRSMQGFGVLSFLLCVICMFCIFCGWNEASYIIFATSIISFIISLLLSSTEITLSMRALELELSDMEELTRTTFFSDILGAKEEKKE